MVFVASEENKDVSVITDEVMTQMCTSVTSLCQAEAYKGNDNGITR